MWETPGLHRNYLALLLLLECLRLRGALWYNTRVLLPGIQTKDLNPGRSGPCCSSALSSSRPRLCDTRRTAALWFCTRRKTRPRWARRAESQVSVPRWPDVRQEPAILPGGQSSAFLINLNFKGLFFFFFFFELGSCFANLLRWYNSYFNFCSGICFL